MKHVIALTAMVGLVLLANSCCASEEEVRPRGCLSRTCARLSACLPEMGLVKKAMPVAVLEGASFAGLCFRQLPPDVVSITIIPLAGAMAMGTVAYRIFKKNEGQNIYKKVLCMMSGGLASWVGTGAGLINNWSPEATGWLSIVCNLSGLGITSTYVLCSIARETQHEPLLTADNQRVNL